MKHDILAASPSSAPVSPRLEGTVGVFVDGENLQSWAAARIRTLVGDHPAMRLCRVYGNYDHLHDWRSTPGFEVIHTGVAGNGTGETVKNASDIKIAVDVMEFALRDNGRTVVLCSSDRDFAPLVWALRRLGVSVVGAGEAKAAESLRAAFDHFEELAPPKKAPAPCQASVPSARRKKAIDKKIYGAAERLGGHNDGALISAFNAELRRSYAFNISSMPDPADRQWRKYFANRPETYRIDSKGPEAKVWLIPDGSTKN